MSHGDRLDQLVDDVLAGKVSRRDVLRRAGALGLSGSALGLLLNLQGAAPAAAAGKLTIASYASDPVPRQQMEADVAAFEEKTGIDVTLNTVAHESFKQAIRTYLASDDPPDVLTWFAGNRMRFFVDKGLIMPVTDLFESEGWTTAYPEGILNVCKGSDGNYYFVPTSYYWWAVYYRPSLFQKAGIEAPPENWDQFLAAVDKLKAADIIPITIGVKAPWPAAGWFDYLNMRINGPEFHIQLTDGKVAYNSPEVKEVFRRWRELLDRNAFIDAPESYAWQDALTPMVQGEAAMYLMGGFIRDSYPDDQENDLDFFRFPIIDASKPIGEDAPTDGFFAAAKAKNVEEAKEWLKYVGSREYQEAAARNLKRIAIHKDVPLEVYDPPTQKGVKLLQSANYIAQFYDRDTTPEMAEKGMNAFIQFWQNPDDIDKILDDLDAERQRIFSAES